MSGHDARTAVMDAATVLALIVCVLALTGVW